MDESYEETKIKSFGKFFMPMTKTTGEYYRQQAEA